MAERITGHCEQHGLPLRNGRCMLCDEFKELGLTDVTAPHPAPDDRAPPEQQDEPDTPGIIEMEGCSTIRCDATTDDERLHGHDEQPPIPIYSAFRWATVSGVSFAVVGIISLRKSTVEDWLVDQLPDQDWRFLELKDGEFFPF